MNKYIGIMVTFLAVNLCFGAVSDSSTLIFSDSAVNDYHIAFYIPEWHDSLIANKSNDETYVPARFVWHGAKGDSIVLDSCGVRYKGNSSYAIASEKKPFKVYFGKYRKNQRFFSLEKLNFGNGILDPTMMREKLAYDILGKLLPAPRAAFATLSVGDTLVKAFYTQVEQVDEQFLACHFGTAKYNLYKAGDQGVSLAYKAVNQSVYESDYELKTNEAENDWSDFISMLYELNNATDAAFVKTVGRLLNLDNCIRYLAFNMVNANFDSYTGSGRNFYLYGGGKTGNFKLIPWDVNLSFGAYAYSWKSNLIGVDAFNTPNLEQRPLAKRILANDSLKRVYGEFMKTLINGPLSSDSVAARAHAFKALIDSNVKADVRKFYTYEQFTANIDTEIVFQEGAQKTILPGLKSFTAKRNANLLGQIVKGLPVLREPKSRVNGSKAALRCFTGQSGRQLQVRYTVNPSDAIVEIRLFNASGAVMRTTREGIKKQGFYSVSLNTLSLPSGYYTVQLKIGSQYAAQGIVLVKP